VIVRGDSSGNPILKHALNLRTIIREKCRNNLPISTDFTPDEGKPEILVGFTNRPESAQVAEELTDTVQFIIRAVNNKIVIVAATQNNLAAAIDYFANEILPGKVNSISDINHTQINQSLILLNTNTQCSFVIPDDADADFATCAQSMLDTLQIPGLSIVRYSDYLEGPAVMIGKIASDPISTAYSLIVKENEYIGRTAAGNVYLQGHTDLLTLTAFGDFLVNLQTNADRDMAGNRCLSTRLDYAFNTTWEFTLPKPLHSTLDNSESITGSSHIFYYSSVSDYAYSLFKQMLSYLGYTVQPYKNNEYALKNATITLNYLIDDQTLSVFYNTARATE
jgi:hypothetical protein